MAVPENPGVATRDLLQGFVERYRSALEEYVGGAGEAALERAYELGRRAIADGLGILEMAAVHEEAVKRLSATAPELMAAAGLVKSAQFFAESLSPFEMTHRGFREANAKLRSLSEYLQSVREEERTRIARDIHDELGQALTCLKIDLSWLRDRLSPNRASAGQNEQEPGDRKPLLGKMHAMLSLVDTTIRAVRRIVTELRPAILDDLGLVAAIEWQAQEFQARTGVQCSLTLPFLRMTLDQRRSTAIFRVFQEALTNVARHSGATRVNISLMKKGGDVILEVTDNGKGITEREIADANSLGLLGMRERAVFWGGEVQITGVAGKGTTVAVRIPISAS